MDDCRLHTFGTGYFTCALFAGLALAPLPARAQSAGIPLEGIAEVLVASAQLQCGALALLRTLSIDEALTALYQANRFAPLWQDAARLAALQRELRELVDDGLVLADYAAALAATPARDTCAELRLSSVYLLAIEQLSQGRLDLPAIEPRWQAATLPQPAASEVIDLAQRGVQDLRAAFDAARPSLPLYRELRAAFAHMHQSPAARQPIPAGPTLLPGASDARVAQIAQRLREENFLDDAAPVPAATYSPELQRAVEFFQEYRGLEIDGRVGPQTLAALNRAPAQALLQVRVNLERMRWLDAQGDADLLLVNVAGGDMRLYQAGKIVWRSRVLTGQPARPTPLLVSRIDRITLNPSWTVPPTILKEDKLPQIRADLGFLADNELQVLDYAGNPVDPAQVDWTNPVGILLRQAPGPRNPLGALAFRMASPFSVYLHDTPARDLFTKELSNISSGCIRVEDAEGLAEQLLAGRSSQERAEIARLRVDGATHEVYLPEGPRLIIAYWTAEAARDGRVKFFRDPYALDSTLINAFESTRAANAAALSDASAAVAMECHR
ncbi:MAG: hypothetical protein RLZZ227_2004 [Pseudomonadota bacterium]